MLFLNGFIKKQHEIVDDADEMALGFQSVYARCPGFFFIENIFKSIEDFFDLPAQKVKPADNPRPELVAESRIKRHFFTGFRVNIFNNSNHGPRV